MLKLIEMTQERFQHYMLSAVETFAKEKVLNGTWAEEQAFQRLRQNTIYSCLKASKPPITIFILSLKREKSLVIFGRLKVQTMLELLLFMISKFMKNFKIKVSALRLLN